MQLFGKRIKEYKQFLFKKQNGRCALCNNEFQDESEAHLDHDHVLFGNNAGRCRQLLCRACNVTDGRIKHQFIRNGMRGRIEYQEFLRRLADYVEADYSENPYHQNFINDYLKYFKRLNLPEQKQEYKKFNFDLPSGKITKQILEQDFQKKFKKHQKEL